MGHLIYSRHSRATDWSWAIYPSSSPASARICPSITIEWVRVLTLTRYNLFFFFSFFLSFPKSKDDIAGKCHRSDLTRDSYLNDLKSSYESRSDRRERRERINKCGNGEGKKKKKKENVKTFCFRFVLILFLFIFCYIGCGPTGNTFFFKFYFPNIWNLSHSSHFVPLDLTDTIDTFPFRRFEFIWPSHL